MNMRFGLGTQVGCQSRPTGLGRDKSGIRAVCPRNVYRPCLVESCLSMCCAPHLYTGSYRTFRMSSFLLILDRAIELYYQDNLSLTDCYVYSDASKEGDSRPEGQGGSWRDQ